MLRSFSIAVATVMWSALLMQPDANAASHCGGGRTRVSAAFGNSVCVSVRSPGSAPTRDARGGRDHPVELRAGLDAFRSSSSGPDLPDGQSGSLDGELRALRGIGIWTTAPQPQPQPQVSPVTLAHEALGRLRLRRPSVRLAPSPPLKTYVHLETWLWVPRGQWRPLSLSVSAGATSVRVVASPVRVFWDMGDERAGTSCLGPGRAWIRGMSAQEETDCSYTYRDVSSFEPGGKFRVQASLVYQVDWTCTGACPAGQGSLGEIDGPTGMAAIRVGERQSVVTSGD